MNLMELMSRDINAAFLVRNPSIELQIQSGVQIYSFPGITLEQMEQLTDNLQTIIEAAKNRKKAGYDVKIHSFNNNLPERKTAPIFLDDDE